MEPSVEFERIEAFLYGQMPAVEMEAFRQELEARPELAKRLQLHQEAHHQLEHALSLRWKSQMQGWHNQKEESKNKKTFLFRNHRFLWVAILVFLIAVPISWYVWVAPADSPSGLYAQYQEVPPLSLPRSGTESDWLEIARLYEAKEFEQAIPLFLQLLSTASPEAQPKAVYYLGVCYLQAGMPAQALLQFQKVSPLSSYTQDAQWAKVLCYLALEDIPNAQLILKEIVTSPGHYRQQEARELLAKLPV